MAIAKCGARLSFGPAPPARSGMSTEIGVERPHASTASRWLTPMLLAGIALLALVSLGLGAARIPPWLALKALLLDQGSASIIVRELRLPRTLLAVLIGFNLGVTGAALQGLLRNPLADA